MFRVQYSNSIVDFSIKESFGPFEDENLKLILTQSKSGMILLLIGRRRIYGIDSEDGEILFEIQLDFEIFSNIAFMVEGCLLCLDSEGLLRLIEIHFETGQILSTWSMICESETLVIESISLNDDHLIIKLSFKMIGKVILVFKFDPLSEVVPCIFRHWIITEEHNEDDNKLPFIVKKRGEYSETLY